MSSVWADNYCRQRLAMHYVDQRTRSRFDRAGQLRVRANDVPVQSVLSMSYGYTPAALTTINSPAYWDESGNLVFPANVGPWSGSLNFTGPGVGVGEMYMHLVYLAGWATTAVAGGSAAGSSSVAVADATGMAPGETYRIWEPGVEETVTISPDWVPPATLIGLPLPATLTLTAPLTFAHTTGAGVSAMPADVHLAVINYSVAQLMRPDTSKEDAFPDTGLTSGIRKKDPRKDGSGLVTEAERLLRPYRRVVP
jgi:hypothetical protein